MLEDLMDQRQGQTYLIQREFFVPCLERQVGDQGLPLRRQLFQEHQSRESQFNPTGESPSVAEEHDICSTRSYLSLR